MTMTYAEFIESKKRDHVPNGMQVAGIGSEGYMALKLGRKFVGVELKESYYKQACANLDSVRIQAHLEFEL